MSQPVFVTIASSTDAEPETKSDELIIGETDIDIDILNKTVEIIRPALHVDGGDMVLREVDGNTVTVELVGACVGCPMSEMTLTAGIRRVLIDRVPGVETVETIE